MVAVESGQIEAVKALATHGANLNQVNKVPH